MSAVLTIPNLLTIGRIVLIIFFFSAGLQGQWTWALTFFAIAGFTDLIDGTVARLLNQRSQVGALLDPAADKLMMLAGITLLTINYVVPWWLMALFIGRDLLIILGLWYLWSQTKNIEYQPSKLSKFNTLAQIMTVVCGLTILLGKSGAILPNWMNYFSDALPVLIGIATVSTIASSIQYYTIGMRLLRSDNG
jgi:cardiolipin synthase (CMP-forming)